MPRPSDTMGSCFLKYRPLGQVRYKVNVKPRLGETSSSARKLEHSPLVCYWNFRKSKLKATTASAGYSLVETNVKMTPAMLNGDKEGLMMASLLLRGDRV